jgi:protein TonB
VPHPAPKTRPAPKSVKGTRTSGAGGTSVSRTAAPTAAPTPLPATTAGNPCADPNAGAAVVTTPPPPDIPVAARAQGTSGIALVKVQLDDAGAITGAAVSQSSGNPSLDDIAVGMARAARYAPAMHACKPVAGDYTFSVKFVAW